MLTVRAVIFCLKSKHRAVPFRLVVEVGADQEDNDDDVEDDNHLEKEDEVLDQQREDDQDPDRGAKELKWKFEMKNIYKLKEDSKIENESRRKMMTEKFEEEVSFFSN